MNPYTGSAENEPMIPCVSLRTGRVLKINDIPRKLPKVIDRTQSYKPKVQPQMFGPDHGMKPEMSSGMDPLEAIYLDEVSGSYIKDVLAPLPFDPKGRTPFMAGDLIKNRRGLEAEVKAVVEQGLYIEDTSKVNGLKTVKWSTLDGMHLRLAKRECTCWSTYLIHVIRSISWPKDLDARDVRVWAKAYSNPEPHHHGIYERMFDHSRERYKDISGFFPQNVISFEGLDIKDMLRSPVGPDIWHESILYDIPAAYGTMLGKQSNRYYSKQKIRRRYTERYTEWCQEGESEDPDANGRPEVDAYGFSEDMSDEEMLDEFLLDD
jgi:hypothetical protein